MQKDGSARQQRRRQWSGKRPINRPHPCWPTAKLSSLGTLTFLLFCKTIFLRETTYSMTHGTFRFLRNHNSLGTVISLWKPFHSAWKSCHSAWEPCHSGNRALSLGTIPLWEPRLWILLIMILMILLEPCVPQEPCSLELSNLCKK